MRAEMTFRALRAATATVATVLFAVSAVAPAPANADTSAPATGHAEASHGKNKKRVLTVAFPEGANASAAAAKIAYIVESAVRRSTQYEPVDLVAKLDPAGAQARTEASDRGNDAIVAGFKSYSALDNGLGAESFDRAFAAFPESPMWENFRGYVKADTMRILLKWSDDPTGTHNEIVNLLTVDPKAEFPREVTVPQDLAAEMQKQRDTINAAPHVSFDLNANPVPARVYVDGTYRGTTPATVEGLAVGEHFASFVAAGFEVVQQQIHVAPGGSVTVPLKAADKGRSYFALVQRLQHGFNDTDEVAAGQTLQKLSGADDLVDISVARHEGMLDIVLHRLRLADGHCAAAASVSNVQEADPQLPALLNEQAKILFSADHSMCGGGPCVCGDISKAGPVRNRHPVDMRAVRIGTGVSAAALIVTGVSLGVDAYVKGQAFIKVPQINIGNQGTGVLVPAVASDVCNGLGIIMAGVWAYVTFGIPYEEKADIPGPSSMDPAQDPTLGGKPDAKPDRPPPHDDPFESQSTSPKVPTLAFLPLPMPGGFAFSLQGAF